MTLFAFPWMELALVVPLVGAILATRSRDPRVGWRIGFAFSTTALVCSALASAGHHTGVARGGATPHDLLPRLVGQRVLGLDDLNAPLLPLVALLHSLIIVGTTGGKAVRLSFGGVLALEAIHLATFATIHPQMLAGFLVLGALLPLVELSSRGQSTRLYLTHMGTYAALLVIGVLVGHRDGSTTPLAWIPLTIAVLIRCGIAPGHLWVSDLYSRATFGTAILLLTPMTGILAAMRLVFPVCPPTALEGIGALSVMTAVYAAGLAVVQREARRLMACLCISSTALVLAGLTLPSEFGKTAALSLWMSAGVTLTGAAFALRALESRIGEISLVEFRGLYDRAPALAVCFLFAGLGTVGFPGTLGFLPFEVLIAGGVSSRLLLGIGMVLTVALNGFAVVRAYALVFTGSRHYSAIPLGVTQRERYTVLALAVLVLGGGLLPQPLFEMRQPAARALLEQQTRFVSPIPIASALGP